MKVALQKSLQGLCWLWWVCYSILPWCYEKCKHHIGIWKLVVPLKDDCFYPSALQIVAKVLHWIFYPVFGTVFLIIAAWISWTLQGSNMNDDKSWKTWSMGKTEAMGEFWLGEREREKKRKKPCRWCDVYLQVQQVKHFCIWMSIALGVYISFY